MLRRIARSLVLVVSLAGNSFAQQAARDQAKQHDLSFIPNDASLAIVVQPRQILSSKQAQWWPTEILSAYGKKYAGFDPLDVERATMFFVTPDKNGGNMLAAAALQFRQPMDANAIGARITPDGKEEEYKGRRLRRAQNMGDATIVYYDERTILITNFQDDYQSLLAAQAGDGPLVKVLNAADDSPELAIYVALEPVRPMLAMTVQQLQFMAPPMIHPLLDLPAQVDTAQLTAKLKNDDSDGIAFQLKLNTPDAPAAEGVATTIDTAMKQARMMLLAEFEEEKDENAEQLEVKVASMKYAERLGDELIAALHPKVAGNTVIMNAEINAGVGEAGLLTAFLLPAVQASREAAQRNQSQNNLKQIALCLLNHEDKHKRMPAAATYDKDGKPLLSWRVYMLPEMEEGALFKEFHLDEPWDSEHNKKLIDRMPATYKHPKLDQPGKTVYLAVVGKGAAFEGKQGLGLRNFTDGTSKTITVIEVAPEKAVPWTKPEDWEFDPAKDIDTSDFGGLWQGDIFNALFADGHVIPFSRSVDPGMLKTMFTRNAGD